MLNSTPLALTERCRKVIKQSLTVLWQPILPGGICQSIFVLLNLALELTQKLSCSLPFGSDAIRTFCHRRVCIPVNKHEGVATLSHPLFINSFCQGVHDGTKILEYCIKAAIFEPPQFCVSSTHRHITALEGLG